MTTRTTIAGLLAFLGFLAFLAAYIGSIYICYKANGLLWSLLIATPVLGQLLWFGVMWQSSGFLNWYVYLLGSMGVLWGAARLIGGETTEELG